MGVLGGAEAFPRHGRLGVGAIVAGVGVAAVDAAWAPSAAAILAWWGLALALDGAAYWRRRASVLRDAPDAFVWMAVLSIFLGVAVEWAAGQLAVWAYLGLPGNEFLRYLVQGVAFAAFLPALHGAAGVFGALRDSPPAAPVSRRWAVAAALAGGGALAGVLASNLVAGLSAMLIAMAGLWLLCDGANALRERPNLLAQRKGQLRAWVDAGLLLVAASAAIDAVSGQGRTAVQIDGPVFYAYALLAVSGPSLRAAYLCLADSAGVPAWPPRQELSSLLR